MDYEEGILKLVETQTNWLNEALYGSGQDFLQGLSQEEPSDYDLLDEEF